LVYVNKKIADEKKDYILNGGDVVIQTVGSWPNNPESVVGKVIRIPSALNNSLLNQNAVIFRPKDGLCGDYLFYLLKDKNFKGYIINTAQGAANQASITLDSIFRFEFYIPPFEVQRRIAAILSAYDDLIENNKRRITLLEKMSEEIYREWYVRMRFPGHENAKFVNGVPANWTMKAIGAICDRVTDGSHLSPEFHPNGKYMASVKDMQSYGFTLRSIKTISDQDFQKLAKADCKPLKNDVLIAKDGSYLKHVFVWNHNYDIVLLSSIAILRPNINLVLPYFLAIVLKQNSTKSMMSGYVSGSALPRIILKDFKKMKLLIPESNLIKQFESIVEPMFHKINILDRQIEKLEITRDKLLLRLVSGKLSVELLNIQHPPSMQNEQDVAHA